MYKDHATRVSEAHNLVFNTLKDYGVRVLDTDLVGSTYITNKQDSDVDVLVLIAPNYDLESMGGFGWSYGGSVGEGNDSTWASWKKSFDGIGEVNMLVTADPAYYAAWRTAAEVCRYLHLQGVQVDRKQRVSIHNIIMDDSTADAENPPGWLTGPVKQA